jgi:photosystem II stability/assembly factor-like uncharacterized protein
VVARFHGNGKRRRLGRVIDRDPFDPDRIIAGEDWDGVFVSEDNGESWMPSGLDCSFLCDIRFDRAARGRIYASAPERVKGRAADFLYDPTCKSAFGFFRSDDYGASWRKLSDESPVEIVQILGSSAIIGIFEERFVRRSDDGGESWRDFGEGLPLLDRDPDKTLQRGRFNALACSKKGGFWVVGDTDGNFFRRGVNDTKWVEVVAESYVHPDPVRESWFARSRKRRAENPGSLVIDDQDESHWLLTDWYNIMESNDAGRNWRSCNVGMQQLCPFVVSCDPLSPSNIVYGVADMGVFCSTNGGDSYFSPRCSGGVNSVAWSSKTKGLVLVTGGKSAIEIRRSRDSGAFWEVPSLSGLPPLSPCERAAYTISENPKTGAFFLTVSGKDNEPGGAGVYMSMDAGDSWAWCGRGLPTNLAGELKSSEFDANNSQVVFSSDGSGVLTLLSGQVYYWVPQSGEWKESNLKSNLNNWDTLVHPSLQIVADPHTPGRYLSSCFNGYYHIGESKDGGRTFTRTWMQTGAVYAISFDQGNQGVIYASKIDGIYFSRDDGKHWFFLEESLSLPCGASRRIYADRNRLFFLTDGSGVWVRDI